MTAIQLPAEIQQLMGDMWRDIQRDNMEREEKKAKADPKAHKLSKVFENSNYRYIYAGRNGRNQSVWYCWSSHRNVAGYFLGWRETHLRNKTGKRDQWAARKSRKAVQELAKRRAARFHQQFVAEGHQG